MYVVLGYIVDKYCLGFDRGVIPVCCACLNNTCQQYNQAQHTGITPLSNPKQHLSTI
jgi:hypothetical protein